MIEIMKIGTTACQYLRFEHSSFLSRCKRIVEILQEHSSQILMPHFIVFPEYFLGSILDIDRSVKIEQLSEKHLNLQHEAYNEGIGHLKEWTKDHPNVVLVPGTYLLKRESGKMSNRADVISAGKVLTSVDKRHSFAEEQKHLSLNKTKPQIIETMGIKYSIAICADFWFLNTFREVFMECDLILGPIQAVVSNNDYSQYGKFYWNALSITRAKENVVSLCIADSPAPHSSSITGEKVEQSYAQGSGASIIVDPTIRFTNDSSSDLLGISYSNPEKEMAISQNINIEEVREYKKYRKSVGLLPDF